MMVNEFIILSPLLKWIWIMMCKLLVRIEYMHPMVCVEAQGLQTLLALSERIKSDDEKRMYYMRASF